MDPLTKKQKDILDYIRSFVDDNGYAPSYREIAHFFELSSTGTIAEYINILAEKGYLTKDAMEARAIQLTPAFDDGVELHSVALMGVIDAGLMDGSIQTNVEPTKP